MLPIAAIVVCATAGFDVGVGYYHYQVSKTAPPSSNLKRITPLHSPGVTPDDSAGELYGDI